MGERLSLMAPSQGTALCWVTMPEEQGRKRWRMFYQVAAAVSMKGQSSLHSSSAHILGQLECSLQMPTKLEIKTSKSSRPHSNTLFSVPYGTSTILGKQLYKITRATEIHYNLCIISV